jgi:hypothetical protein
MHRHHGGRTQSGNVRVVAAFVAVAAVLLLRSVPLLLFARVIIATSTVKPLVFFAVGIVRILLGGLRSRWGSRTHLGSGLGSR